MLLHQFGVATMDGDKQGSLPAVVERVQQLWVLGQQRLGLVDLTGLDQLVNLTPWAMHARRKSARHDGTSWFKHRAKCAMVHLVATPMAIHFGKKKADIVNFS